MRLQFDAQRVQVMGNLDYSRIGQKGYKKKDWLDDLLDWGEADTAFAESIKPVIQAVLIETGRSAMQEIGKQPSLYDPFTPALREYFANRSLKIAADVNDETAKQLRAALSQGVLAGESTYQLRARVEAIFGSASTMRADRIARTEVARAQGFADIQAWTQSGVVSAKEFYTARDDRVCPGCSSLDGKVYGLTQNIFDKGDTLTVGDYRLKLDYDDVPSAPIHVGCRCVLLPVRA